MGRSSDHEDAVDTYVRDQASRMDEWMATQQLVPYNDDDRDATGGTIHTKRKRSKRNNHNASLRPRAEIAFPLQWIDTFPQWDRQRSRVTTSTRLPLYSSQDRLLEHRAEQQPAAEHSQELVCDISMTTLQRNFQDTAYVSSAQLKGIHHHGDGVRTSSITLGVQRQRNDVLSLALQTSAPKYGVTTTMFYNTQKPFVRCLAHADIGFWNWNIRPDLHVNSLHNVPECGVTVSSSGVSKWDVRCGLVSKSLLLFRDWRPTVRFRWNHPFSIHVLWRYGRMLQCESSWRATSGRHGAHCRIAVGSAKHWNCILAYTLGDVTLRVPIVIATSLTYSWQVYALRWLVATVVSKLVHVIVSDVVWNQKKSTQTRSLQQLPNRQTALLQQSFMKRQAMMRYKEEKQKDGLLIETATYRLEGADSLDVATVLRFWVSDSQLELHSKLSMMLGFCDLSEELKASSDGNVQPSTAWETIRRFVSRAFQSDESSAVANEPKLDIQYEFQGQRYGITVDEDEHVKLPNSKAIPIQD